MEPIHEGNERELSKIIDRAQRITDETEALLASDPHAKEIVAAAQEAGLDRDAILQALRERLNHATPRFAPGDYVFAKSYEGYGYAAAVVDNFGDDTHVRFLNGGEGTVSTSDLRPLGLMPGMTVEFRSKSSGYPMWVSGQVIRFNSETKSVTVNYWGMSEEIVSLEVVRLPRQGQKLQLTTVFQGRMAMVAMALAVGIVSAILISIIGRR